MEFVLMSIKIIGTLIVLILLMLLLLKFNESKLNEVNSRKTIRVIERTQLSKDVSLQIIKIGKKAYVMSVSPSKGEFIKELTEEELNEIEVLKKIEI
ncbi:MAG: flagellar biosynthetic protein FliO [Clostridium sp.]